MGQFVTFFSLNLNILILSVHVIYMKTDNMYSLSICFYFLITYGVCKKRKNCNRMNEKKKNSLLLRNVYDFYVLEDKTSQKNSRQSVCLSGCLDVRTYVDFSCGHNNF